MQGNLLHRRNWYIYGMLDEISYVCAIREFISNKLKKEDIMKFELLEYLNKTLRMTFCHRRCFTIGILELDLSLGHLIEELKIPIF